MTKLAGLKPSSAVMALQSAKKISGLYADLAKQAYKPARGSVTG
jgi:hypothetical protein